MARNTTEIVCIGSALWDVIGRTASHMRVGSDVPGRITRIPGGVVLNIAMTLRRFGLRPVLLTAIGRDSNGTALVVEVERMGIRTDCIYRSDDLPTDVYMAIEGANGLIAAIADAHSLEAAGNKILAPLTDGRLGSLPAPFDGTIALDGNLTAALLTEIATQTAYAQADLRVAPASPGKAERLMALLDHPSATFYVNLEEAGLICQTVFDGAEAAAAALVRRGVARALVTDGARPAAEATPDGSRTRVPPEVLVTRVTGAGDTFMAAHIAAELDGAAPETALKAALDAAAAYVSGETPL
ncbi:MAG: PfkB family carbohydrate kinase [Pseudomonadota bacterium]